MIKSLEAKFFRKHEDLKIDFTSGLNVLRGPNEIGKTTVTEIILYALFGAAVLIDKFEEVVTWGQKESALKVKVVISISGHDYVFTRSKAGAEVNYAGVDGKAVKVTGQKEVTAFAAQLLGADAKTASVLMLSSQAGLRGALDEGPAAVGALMGKLADFDTIDKLLDTAAQTLSLGSIVPTQVKLAEADNEVVVATASLTDPAILAVLDSQLAKVTVDHAAANAAGEALSILVSKADDAQNAAHANNNSHAEAQRRVAEMLAGISATRGRLAEAEVAAAKRPDPAAVAAATQAHIDAKNHAVIAQAHATFLAIPAYPEVSWDEDKASFDAARAVSAEALTVATMKLREADSDKASWQRQIIKSDGKCPTCGHLADNHSHVVNANLAIEQKIAALLAVRPALIAAMTEISDNLATLDRITTVALKRQTFIDRCREYVTIDDTVYPSKVTWSNGIPSAAPDVASKKAAIDAFAYQERCCVLAEGQVAVYTESIADQTTKLTVAVAVAARLAFIPTEPFQEAYDAAYQAYAAQATTTRELSYKLEELKAERAEVERISKGAAQRLETAKGRVVEYIKDIATLEFNNELVRKLKSMKPQITDFLWNNVLAAVGNFFSVLRGEQSIVTKDAAGFRVNGRGGSLSGSTLDMLALAIRVALSKTFVPHANFMVLDEPAHGCDNVRASALLGFLSGVGFEQTILASHDELSESVADTVINLGT